MRSSDLGNHATRLETSHAVFSSFELVTRTPPVLEPLRGDPEEPAHTPFALTHSSIWRQPLRGIVKASQLVVSFSDFRRPKAFTLREGIERAGQRHVESTCATRIFDFQRRTPTSCVATEPPSAFAPCDSMNRSFAVNDPLLGNKHLLVSATVLSSNTAVGAC